MAKEVILVGGFHEIIELCEDCNYSIIGIIDDMSKSNYWNYPIIGTDDNATELFNKYYSIPLVITPDRPQLRSRLTDYYRKIGYTFATLISPDAKVSKSAIIEEGVVIQAGVNVSAACRIGAFSKLNTGCNIMHDVVIENFCTIAPNAVVLGRVKIAEFSYIGSNSTILSEIQIGKNVTIGAGAVVTKNITNGLTAKGIPAR